MTEEVATARVAEAAVTAEVAAVTAEVATAMVAGVVVRVVVKTAEAVFVRVVVKTAEVVFVRLKGVLVAFLFEVLLLLECAHPFPVRVPFL